jgi:peptidoglycan/xylan/chitin deacetylase (PgdA/CDA1 family)
MIDSDQDRQNGSVLNVLVIGGEGGRRVVVLAEQITRHVPRASICGIAYKVPAPSEAGPMARLRLALKSILEWAERRLLGVIHGGRPHMARRAKSDRQLISRKCQEAGWDLSLTGDLNSSDLARFVGEKAPALVIASGVGAVPRALAAMTAQGIIHGHITPPERSNAETRTSLNPGCDPEAWGLKITHLTPRTETVLARFELPRDPLDTQVSMELKSSVILRDLLVQSVAAVAERPEGAADRVEEWIRTMIPSYLSGSGAPGRGSSIDQAPSLQVHSNWKLCVYSLLLLSPGVLFRNWLRWWRKQHPVIFLNSHLISDRHHRMSLPTEALLRMVKYLQGHYRIVTLTKACELLESGSVDEPTLVLTFDDGYEDNFLNLRAVSEETGVPVVLFLSTDPVTHHREFPHDSDRGLFGFRALTWDQVRYWSAGDAEFGSHTCSHYDCGSTNETLLIRELAESKRTLEQKLGKPARAFAFPFGKPKNMSSTAMAIATKIYDHYLSSFGGDNAPSAPGHHKHLLRKFLRGNAWESELELQDVFLNARLLKRWFRMKNANPDQEAWDAAIESAYRQ